MNSFINKCLRENCPSAEPWKLKEISYNNVLGLLSRIKIILELRQKHFRLYSVMREKEFFFGICFFTPSTCVSHEPKPVEILPNISFLRTSLDSQRGRNIFTSIYHRSKSECLNGLSEVDGTEFVRLGWGTTK